MSEILQTAFAEALKIRENAYAPFSKFKLGAVVKTEGSDELFTGCNVENASFGATICAERVAILSAIKSFKDLPQIEFILLASDPLVMPCGECLQVMAEFMRPSTPLHFADLDSVKESITLQDLLPRAFTEF